MIPTEKIYSSDSTTYDQKSVSARLEALFLNNVGLVVTREQIIAAARNPITGKEPENWHQRLPPSGLRRIFCSYARAVRQSPHAKQ